MGQPDLAVNSLTSHADVFADIINAIIYEGRTVLNETCLKPFYVNSAVSKQGKLKGLYRDTCMEDTRNGIRYVIWGIENQYVDDLTTPFKIMGYDFTAYDKQIEEFMRHNKQNGRDAYVQQLHFDQKLKPVVTLVLYYGTKNIPDNICALMEMPEDTCVKRYIQNYHLNVIRLHTLTPAQAALFQSDFAHIAKFLAKSYNKKEQIEYLMNSKQTVVHTKDTLYTLSAITGEPRYLSINETRKEKPAMCEVAEAIFQMGYNERNNEIAKMDTIIKEKEAALAEKDAQIAKKEAALAEKDAQIAFLMEQLKLKSDF